MINPELTISFSFFSKISQESFEGEFTFQPYLSIGQKLKLTRKLNLLEGATDADHILQYIQTALIKYPSWWDKNKGEDLLDWDIIDELYNQINKTISNFENSKLGK
jgi:hypothetical protein